MATYAFETLLLGWDLLPLYFYGVLLAFFAGEVAFGFAPLFNGLFDGLFDGVFDLAGDLVFAAADLSAFLPS